MLAICTDLLVVRKNRKHFKYESKSFVLGLRIKVSHEKNLDRWQLTNTSDVVNTSKSLTGTK
jgi:hypothetical protein